MILGELAMGTVCIFDSPFDFSDAEEGMKPPRDGFTEAHIEGNLMEQTEVDQTTASSFATFPMFLVSLSTNILASFCIFPNH